MKNLINFLGKPVISLFESNIEGYVKNIIFDKQLKKVKYFVIFEDNEFQDEKMLDVQKVYNFNHDAIIIKNNSCLELKKEEIFGISNHINCKVYSTTGEYLGLIADIELNDDLTTNKVILSTKLELVPTEFLTFGQDIFIKQDQDNIIKLASIRKRESILKSISTLETKVSILPTVKTLSEENTSNKIDLSNSSELPPQLPIFPEPTTEDLNQLEKPKRKYVFNELSLPKKLLLSSSDFLIGRKTTKTIYSSNNEIVAKKNMIINQKILQNAVIYNKIRELAIYSV